MTVSIPPISSQDTARIAFIGGGNMASAIIGGLIEQGMAADRIQVVEPFLDARVRLEIQFGVQTAAAADAQLANAQVVVWAVKPQSFREAAAPVAPFAGDALHLSVAAGIRSDSIAQWLGTERVARAMPNTPALIGKGMTGLYAGAAVSVADRRQVETLLVPTGELLWLEHEAQLDAVTALSGSGPAYVFYFLETMAKAGVDMGLTYEQARHLAVTTFAGASALAHASEDSLEVMRERVTSKGGTTYAAITSMESDRVQASFIKALKAAQQRAGELGDEFGRA
ncbi:pyrroline-5-carboxylate reductase [Variovorax sp. J22R133]|uniref:pyrroline-5-carboxylate reductase n=1 Tax=Variovorax brevis TaxID=3053503 RepID=UPI002574D2AE|nr:pyrroline-5-carboxylate reductase [Variovorax sp. J22R133]MDM0115775.1 pyrroline-5-carboxylate reductase [Variovorax sp. J22R133]